MRYPVYEYAVNGVTYRRAKTGVSYNSGKLDINDATTLQRHLAEYRNSDGSPIINEADKSSFAIADMNADGVIDIRDVTAVQRKIADFEDIK